MGLTEKEPGQGQMLTWALRGWVMLALVLPSACYSTGTKPIADRGLISQIQIGKTSEAEVAALLGFPEATSFPKDERIWKYFYRTEIPTIPSYVPLVKVFKSGIDQENQILSITFTRQGIVKNLERQEIASTENNIGPY
jgi:outer membrane protein assembly factor BamE (lipoprotein component of BamABCDE complex)